MIVIIDYGMGNIQSVLRKFNRMEVDAISSSRPEEIEKAKKLILPGVGAFDKSMENIDKYGLVSVLNKKVLQEKTLILGICLGMQLFSKTSEEGQLKGLGWIDCETVKFKFNNKRDFKIPHIGWNTVQIKKNHDILKNVKEEDSFYFVHSYHLKVFSNDDMILATTKYGYNFISAIQKDNIIGVQFHPEKSHQRGMQILRNFAKEI